MSDRVTVLNKDDSICFLKRQSQAVCDRIVAYQNGNIDSAIDLAAAMSVLRDMLNDISNSMAKDRAVRECPDDFPEPFRSIYLKTAIELEQLRSAVERTDTIEI